MKLICTTCDGLGQERREITHPAANVAGWTREPAPILSNWWRRQCKTCHGEGFVSERTTSVPIIPLRLRS